MELYNKDEDWVTRCIAGEALIRLSDEASISSLIDILPDVMFHFGEESAFSVVHALEEMGEAAVPALIEILTRRVGLGEKVAEALKRMGSKEALDAVRKWEFEP